MVLSRDFFVYHLNKIKRQKNSGTHSLLRQLLLPLIGVLIAILVPVLVFLIVIIQGLPTPADLTNHPVEQSSKILDRHGELLYSIYATENRTVVPLKDIPLSVRQATIAVEDKDFYRHGGINFVGGILRAARDSILNQRLEGGSTITQQLIKMALLSPEQTITRKIREAILASWTERIYSKDEILAFYLNRAPYGGTAYGIEEASLIYFNKHAKNLTLAEAALLAGLPQAPTYYSPFGIDPNRALIRQHEVLKRMQEDGYITHSQAEAAKKEPLVFASDSGEIKAPHFVAYVKEQLVQKYGEDVVQKGGLQVTTTLDLALQETAQASLSAQVEKQKNLKVGNGAALVTKPPTGEILVMIGSKDYSATDGGNVNVTLAHRSPGSSIKPLNVALGFLKGNATPATPWIDARYCFPPFAGKSYCPGNYDGKFHGVVQTRFALGNSYNIPAVKQLALNTVADFIATASAMGLTTLSDDPSRYGYSLALGGGEVRMVDMATAFGVFANQGKRVDLTSLIKVVDSQGTILEDHSEEFKNPDIRPRTWQATAPFIPRNNYVLPAEVTYLISHILLDDGARQATFGPSSVLNIKGFPVSVKTGTAEDKRDNWTIGYTPSFLTAVWVGNNDNSPMSPYLESGNTGAAPIWNSIMTEVLKNSTPDWPPKPENVIFTEVCSLSGLLPNPDHDCPKRGEYFIKGLEPKDKDGVWDQKRKILVYKDSHKQPGPNEKPSPDQLIEEEHIVISDPLQKDFCVDCVQ